MDFRFALRSLLKNPGFTVVAIAIMALGIGANTAVFSVVDSVLLKPLAYPNAGRIVTLRSTWKNVAAGSGYTSAPDFHDWHDQNQVFQALAYYTRSGADGSTAVIVGNSAEYAAVSTATQEFFDVFGVRPVLGRLFTADEFKQGGSGAAVISDAYWRSHFGGNASVLGKILRIYDKPLTIVGVLPPEFRFPDQTDIWFPANSLFSENSSRSSHNYLVLGLLKPGVPLEQAQAQMDSIASRLAREYPNSNRDKGVMVSRLLDTMVRNVRSTLYLLLAAVALLLLMACANMANLLLARATGRTREIAIRRAVGASTGRILKLLITESMVMAVVAGSAGLVLAIWGADALVALAPSNVPRLAETGIDTRVLMFTLAISVLSSLLFGLAPALQAARVDLNRSLKLGTGKGAVGGNTRMRQVLVTGEIAVAVMLLAGAGLLIRSFQSLTNVDVGYRLDKILVAKLDVPASDNRGLERAVQLAGSVLSDARSLPGVVSAGASAALPGSPRSNGTYWIDQMPPSAQLTLTKDNAVFSIVAPGTFATLGIPIKSGRDFNDSDIQTADAPNAAIVNEALVKQSFGGRDPVGRLIFCGLDSPKPMRIVGVAGNVRQWGPARESSPEIFMPYPQHPGWATQLSILVRTGVGGSGEDPLMLAEAMRRKLRERAPDVPVKFTTMTAAFSQSVSTPRFRTLLLAIFAAVAACLAMAGVYGVITYVVSQRTNEIGVRMALGARGPDILKLILSQGMALAAVGLAAGLAGAIAASRLLASLLFQVQPGDPLTYFTVAALVALVALTATTIPAIRAARIDPLVALRQE